MTHINNNLDHQQEMQINHIIAKEFLEEKLGIESTEQNITLFVDYIIAFEKAVKHRRQVNRFTRIMRWFNKFFNSKPNMRMTKHNHLMLIK
jgi:hypothetical protein